MPIASARFLIDFAILLWSTDPTIGTTDEQTFASATEDTSLRSDMPLGSCAPAPDMCAQFGAACVADGLDPQACEGIEHELCPGAKHLSCDAATKVCADGGGSCDALHKVCSDNLAGCKEPACVAAGNLTTPQAVALCYAHPWALDCGAPSSGHCMSLMTWEDCGITSCEWIECMEDVAALSDDQCPALLPASCKPIVMCDTLENDPPPHVADLEGYQALPWRIPPPACPLIETLTPMQQSTMCAAHPFGRPEGCTADPPSAEKCEDFIEQFAGCNITTCEYKACAAALVSPEAECLDIPPECEGISSCTYGFDEPQIFRGCAAPADLCDQLAKECSSADMSLATCAKFTAICEVDACGACDAAIERCLESPTHCEGLMALCDESLKGCGCE